MKNLRLRVKEDGNVYVSCPYGVPVRVIDDFVESRKEWIYEQRKKLSEKKKVEKYDISDGDVITVLGKEYVVMMTEGEGNAFISGSMIIVPVSEAISPETAVLRLLAEKCREKCSEAVAYYLSKADYKGTAPKLLFKLMKSRWGSYNRLKNTITFNLALCKLPEKYVNYVVAHEVTHIFVHNHSGEFYSFGEKIYDNFLKTDRELNKIKIPSVFS